MYLTREQAAEQLTRTGCTDENAAGLLDQALRIYPQAARTSTELITGYAAGTVMDAWYPGNPGIPADLFTISQW
jgi:hypothetical protein